MTHSAEKDALAKVRELHHPVQWKGLALWLSRASQNPLAFVDKWCRECRKPWPCPTSECILPPEK